MNSNLKRIEKELRSFAKRCKEIKYTRAMLFAFLLTGLKTFTAKSDSVESAKKDNNASEYYFESGANTVWNDSNKDLLLVVKAKTNDDKTFDNFIGVEVDGKKLDPSNYEAVRGSVRISIKSSYLRGLSNGNHTITVSFNNGSASTSINIAKVSGPVNTGDIGSLGYVYTFLIAGSIFIAIMAIKRRA